MNKQDLIKRVVRETRCTKRLASQIVDLFFSSITKALKKGEEVTFVGFGTFRKSNRKARIARNPLTGGAVKVPRRNVVRFAAGKALKGAIN
jgi:nucleoid DNA-binding protein